MVTVQPKSKALSERHLLVAAIFLHNASRTELENILERWVPINILLSQS